MEQIVWATGAQYLRYRIPGIIVTQKGTILLYCEARKSPDDWAEMDILLRRSEDGGKTFSEEQKIACGTKERPTVNNPVLMQDGRGRIHFLYCETYAIGGGRVLQRYSDDDGVTWSAPKDISYATFPEERERIGGLPASGRAVVSEHPLRGTAQGFFAEQKRNRRLVGGGGGRAAA